VVDPVDDTYRRQMNRQLTVQESRHKLARAVSHVQPELSDEILRTCRAHPLG
jgi:hypothetical protein